MVLQCWASQSSATTYGTSIFAVNRAERHRSLLVDSIEILRKVVATVKERHPFAIDKEDLGFESKIVSTS